MLRPGLIPKEYINGRRMRYLDPIRMYLFTSALFFLVFFSFSGLEIEGKEGEKTMSTEQRLEYSSILYKKIQEGDTIGRPDRQLMYLTDTAYQIRLSSPTGAAISDTSFLIQMGGQPRLMTARKTSRINVNMGSNWLNRKINDRWSRYNQKHGGDTRFLIADLLKIFLHQLPYLLFISLPFFALLLKWLYIKRKNFLYSDHAIFTLYHYIFSFIMLLILLVFDRVTRGFDNGFIDLVKTLLFLSGGLYLFIAMKRFYAQGFGKTTVKFLLLNISGMLVMLILFLIFLIISLFQL